MSLGFRISVGANVALLGIAGALFMRAPVRSPVPGAPGTTIVTAAPQAHPTHAEAARPPAPNPSGRLTREAIAQLEQAGISRSILAAVVRQDFRRRWNRRTVDLENRFAPKQPPRREYIALERMHDDEEIRQLKEALGEEGYVAWHKEETLRKLNFEEVPMAPAEAEQAYRLQLQLDDKLRSMQMAMEDGDADIADMGTLQLQAQDAFEKELAKLLGQERYNQLKGYTFPIVEGHLEFNELSPSPDQVSALRGAESAYQAGEAALANRLREKPAEAAAIAAELQALSDTREESLRQALGADAYEQLKLEHDPTYQTLRRYAGAWSLKESDLAPVYEKLRAFQDNVDSLRKAAQMSELAGQSADWRTINSAIDQSRQQTELSLQKLIGNDALRRLTRNGMLSGADPNSPHPPAGS